MLAMTGAIVGEPVTVKKRILVGQDRLGDDVYEYDDGVTIQNVLVNPSTTTYDKINDGHPESIRCDLVLYFPRGYDDDLRGALCIVRDITFEVVGSPMHYTEANIPIACDWNMVVKVVRYDG